MASRIDFLGGNGPLVLTPFLILSPLIVAMEVTRSWTGRGGVHLPPGTASFLLTITALFVVLLASTFLSYELAAAARRLALLVVQAYMVFVVVLVLANRDDPDRILVRGAYLGLSAIVLMNLVQSYVFFFDPGWAQTLAVAIDLQPGTYFGVIPRLTGLSHDPNHGGLFAVFLIWLVTYMAPPSTTRTAFVTLGVLSVAATLSRSAVLAGFALWGTTFLAGLELRLTARAIGLGAALAVAGVVTYLAVPQVTAPLAELTTMLSHRLSPDEGSTSDHARLLARGWEVGTDNIRHLLLGIGYGNAFVVTQDIFPGNDYGNFHSLFLTLFVEAGVLALGLGLWLFVHALRSGGGIRPMIVALLVFNLFQQAHTEPILWLSLMMAWVPGWTTQRHTESLRTSHAGPPGLVTTPPVSGAHPRWN